MTPIPRFPIQVPKGYTWLVEQGLVGFASWSQLQPWYFLPQQDLFDASARWPMGSYRGSLFCFARRQDNDDIACFSPQDGAELRVVVIHGWTSEGYIVTGNFGNFWLWMKRVIDDIAEWSQRDD